MRRTRFAKRVTLLPPAITGILARKQAETLGADELPMAVTLNHIAIGFGTRFLTVGETYSKLAALIAVLVAISILGLFVRRFIVRPKWLGQISPESGIIAPSSA